jgi:alkanesulfonate monooxygenase SsuD/methylene tetrahydromethanopterin reductase-like flavin-dependent oxidoreductase (luciferase family)
MMPTVTSAFVARPWFGLYLPQLRISFDDIVERTLCAEAAGFDSVWLMDHLAAPMLPDVDTFEGWTVASALAARTATTRIGHLVLCDPFRHPALLAKMVATLDVISHGRVELGIGWGSVPNELRTFGFGPDPSAVRAAKLRETLQILDLMFTGESFDYDGAHFTLRGARGRPVPVQPRVPVHIGGGGPRLTMPLVRDHADWWNCPGYALKRLDELRPLAGGARISAQHPIGLAGSDAEREDAAALVNRRFRSWGGVVTGTAGEVTDALAAEVERGIEGFVCQFSDFGAPPTIERFMDGVAARISS